MALGVYLLLLNFIEFVLIGYDKRLAVAGKRRISEKVFFVLAFFGGATGNYLGMKMFRHKTQKTLFAWGMPVMIILNISVLFLLIFYWS